MGGHGGVGVSIDTPTPMHPLRPKNSKKKKREKEKLFFAKIIKFFLSPHPCLDLFILPYIILGVSFVRI